MDVINEKVIAIAVLGVIYVVSSFFKVGPTLRIILNGFISLLLILWLLDFFNIYPVLKIIGYTLK